MSDLELISALNNITLILTQGVQYITTGIGYINSVVENPATTVGAIVGISVLAGAAIKTFNTLGENLITLTIQRGKKIYNTYVESFPNCPKPTKLELHVIDV